MSQTLLSATARKLEADGRLPSLPLIEDYPKGMAATHADLVVDLNEVLEKAMRQGSNALNIFADTVIFPADKPVLVSPPLELLSITARAIDTGGAESRLTLNHKRPDLRSTLRIFTRPMEKELAVFSLVDNRSPYDMSDAFTPSGNPTYEIYTFRDGAPSQNRSRIPAGYLERSSPLHKVLTATFAVAADLAVSGENDRDSLAMSDDLLSWLIRWSGMQSDVVQLAERAEALRALMPRLMTAEDGSLTSIVPAVPPLTAESYLVLAKVHSDAASYTATKRLLADQDTDLQKLAIGFSDAFRDRDVTEASTFDELIANKLTERAKLEDAVRRATDTLRSMQFEQKIANIKLSGAIDQDRIQKTFQAILDITMALFQLGLSIGALASGVPGDPTASGRKATQGVMGLKDFVKSDLRKNAGDWILGKNNAFQFFLKTQSTLFRFALTHGKDHKDSLISIGTASVLIGKNGLAIYRMATAKDLTKDIEANIAAATRLIAALPTQAEVRTSWDRMEIEIGNRLDQLLRDSDMKAVHTAATELKSMIQKVTLYGRLVTEQKAARDTVDREIGSLCLRKIGALKKAAAFDDVKKTATTRAELAKLVRSECDLRLAEASVGFFTAAYGFRRAFYYETYSLPTVAKASPRIGRNPDELNDIYRAMTEASQKAKTIGSTNFKRPVEFRDPELLDSLSKGFVVPLTIDLNEERFLRATHVRIRSMQIELDGEIPDDTLIGLQMISDGVFHDRQRVGNIRFVQNSCQLSFEYTGKKVEAETKFDYVRPTPFATWSVSLYKPETLPKVTGLTLTLEGMSSE